MADWYRGFEGLLSLQNKRKKRVDSDVKTSGEISINEDEKQWQTPQQQLGKREEGRRY